MYAIWYGIDLAVSISRTENDTGEYDHTSKINEEQQYAKDWHLTAHTIDHRRRYKRLLHILSINALTSDPRTVINACKVFDFCAPFVRFVSLFVYYYFLIPFVSNVGRDVIRACVSIMPREYQCYDNSFNSIAAANRVSLEWRGKIFQRYDGFVRSIVQAWFHYIRSELTLAVILSRKIPMQWLMQGLHCRQWAHTRQKLVFSFCFISACFFFAWK